MLRNKLPGKGTTIFTVMSKMAFDHGAINLAQGFPDFDGPQALRERVAYHMAHGHNQYAPLAGVPRLREQIAAKVLDLYGCEIDPDLAARSFVVSSFGKTYHVTGWRIGYCIAPRPLMDEFLRIHQFINFSTHAPMQYAIADFLSECPQHHRQLDNFYQQKRDLFLELMAPSRFKLIPSSGTYFQLAGYSAISAEPDTEFATRLTREHKVSAIPISVFYQKVTDQQVIRFCFAKQDDTLREAVKRLVNL